MIRHNKRQNINSYSTSFISSSNLNTHLPKRPETAATYLRVCSHCNISFKSQLGLADHIIRKHPSFISTVTRKIHECTKCDFKTTISSYFKKHQLEHPETATYYKFSKCVHCNMQFFRKSSLDDHILKLHPSSVTSITNKIHECTECTYKTTSISNLKTHAVKHFELPGNHIFSRCTYCNKTFAHKASLNQHITTVHPDFMASVSCKIHECTKCTYKTTMSSRLKEHMVTHPELACAYCNKAFTIKSLLHEHITKKHPDFIASVSCKVHQCTKCSFKTTRSSNLKEHMVVHHELADNRIFNRCPYCNETFSRKASLNDHITKKHPDFIASISSKIHVCTKCTYKTTRSSRFKEHMAKHPELSGNCVFSRCTYCNRTFAHKALLNEHITKKHPEFIASVSCKIHECTKCTYKTTRSSSLKEHMVKHPELASNPCTYCEETFTRKALLNEHITKKHPEFLASVSCKIHECTNCTFKTTRSSHLRDHMAKHPDLADSVFSRCTYCNKTFTRKASLNKHITKIHPDFIA
nr:unnamed protein product [Callosobruchus analis]